jgi:hypothetical protein
MRLHEVEAEVEDRSLADDLPHDQLLKMKLFR